MRGVAGQHRPTARLGNIADQEPRPAVMLRGLARQFLDQRDGIGMAEAAVARKPHRLPCRPVDRQRLGAGEAALGIKADRLRRAGGRRGFRREQHLGGRREILGNSGRCRHRKGEDRGQGFDPPHAVAPSMPRVPAETAGAKPAATMFSRNGHLCTHADICLFLLLKREKQARRRQKPCG